MAIEPRLRVLAPEARRVGWYVSPGWNDHSVLTYFLGEGGNVTGVVVSPAMSERQKALRQAARTQGAQVVLDPHVMEQAFRGGNARGSIQRLPWARTSPATPSELAGHNGAELIQMLVSAIAEAGADAVISPTHYLSKGIRDPWWPVDLVLALRLRRELDRQGFRDVRIFHRLAVPAALLRDDPSHLSNIAAPIPPLPIDALWLRTHPSGVAHSGPFVFKGLLQGCSALHAIGVPLVFERGGPVGVALTAFGVAGGIESAICGGESFDVNALRQLPDPSVEGFGPPIRVFVPELMSYVPKDEAYALLGNRLMNARYGCRGRCCAKSGPEGSVRDSRRHFLYTFSDQLA